MSRRFGNLRRILALDPATDFQRIYRIHTTLEFPWDTTQALSFALFRTYGVPSIGNLLYRTGEFTGRTQKRYDDTTLILDAVIEHGMASEPGRTSIRRMNRMHGAYSIPNDELIYVLATFVVCPIRWIDEHGWRKLSEHERVAMANFYSALGDRMGITDLPETHQEYSRFMDEYEAKHFGFDVGGREVADATLRLLGTFRPFRYLPAPVVRRVAAGLMDESLLGALGLASPGRTWRRWPEACCGRGAALSVRSRRAGRRGSPASPRPCGGIRTGTRSATSAPSRIRGHPSAREAAASSGSGSPRGSRTEAPSDAITHRAMGRMNVTLSGIQWVRPPITAGPASRPT
jgi:hypothetical protein